METLNVDVDGRIGRLTLTRPKSLNPLSNQCLDELIEAAAWFDEQPDVRVVVVTGEGRAFSAGADLAGLSGPTDRDPREGADAGRLMVEAIEQMKAVTIAAIHGHCVGGAILLAAACDLRISAESTRFAIPEVDIGIPLAWGGIPRLVREIGPALTRDLVLSCRPFTANEALVAGFVSRVVDDGLLVDEVQTLAAELAEKSLFTLRTTLDAVDAAAEALVPTDNSSGDADLLVAGLRDPESREVARRYFEKRQARSSG